MKHALAKLMHEYNTLIIEIKGISPKLSIHKELKDRARALAVRIKKLSGKPKLFIRTLKPKTTKVNGVNVRSLIKQK